MTRLPENFIFLHAKEEQLRLKSIAAIETDTDLMLHLEVIEAAMDVCDILRQFPTDDEDLKVIQLFGIRMFNAFASSIKLVMSGYYQKGGMILRDVLETVFLADFFHTDRSAIARWRFAEKGERMKSFSPVRIREALDKRDGNTEKKRAEVYEMLSELAGHPNMKSAMMLRPQGTNDAYIGPFYDFTALRASIGEMGKLALQVGETLGTFFPADWVEGNLARQPFLQAKARWVIRFYPSVAAKLQKGEVI